MKLDQQTAMNQQNENNSAATDGQFYIRAVSKKTSTELPKMTALTVLPSLQKKALIINFNPRIKKVTT